jgi:hypothetical protein
LHKCPRREWLKLLWMEKSTSVTVWENREILNQWASTIHSLTSWLSPKFQEDSGSSQFDFHSNFQELCAALVMIISIAIIISVWRVKKRLLYIAYTVWVWIQPVQPILAFITAPLRDHKTRSSISTTADGVFCAWT